MSPNSVPSKADPRDPTIYFIQDDCGQTLQTYIRNRYIGNTADILRVVPVQAIAAILRDLLDALVYLERLGVLHRDIKADNVLVFGAEPNYAAKLIDFGLAKKFDSGHSNVPALFRRQYAPEALGLQHLGLARQYTHDSDLWAVGTATRH